MSSSKLLAPYAGPWDEQKARHLLNRTGFSAPMDQVESALKESPDALVHRRLNYESTPDSYPRPEWATPPTESQLAEIGRAMQSSEAELRQLRKDGETDKKALRLVMRKGRLLEQDLERRDGLTIYSQKFSYTSDLQKWWLRRMAETTRPLQEKLTLFWHGHFATSIFKVDSAYYMWMQNETMRRNASGNFHTMIMEISKDPAMIKWLDNNSNVKEHPNENYAREVMELFTLGEGHYTEDDIKQAARAFTGWGYGRRTMRFQFNTQQHDGGEKNFMGQKGNWDGGDIVDIIFQQPACAQFIARKLWTYFAYEEPEPEIVDGLAEILRENKYEMKPMLQKMFLCQAFFSERSIRTQIKSPVQLAVGSCQLLQREIPGPIESFTVMVRSMRLMGQELLLPADVSGWKGGLSWINTASLLMRYNFSNFLVNGVPTEVMVDLRTAKQEYISDAVAKVKEKEKAIALPKTEQVKRASIEALAPGKICDLKEARSSDQIVRHLVRLLWDGQADEESLRQFKLFLDTHESGAADPFDPDKPNAAQKIRGLVHLMMSTPNTSFAEAERYPPMKHIDLHTRRDFLRHSTALASVAWTVPTFLHRTIRALDHPEGNTATALSDGRILLVVQMSGGNDGLSTVVPFTNDAYYKARPKLAVRQSDVLKINDHFGFCPEFAPLKPLYDGGKMAVLQGIGYPNPNRSHFRSMEIWHTASDSDKNEKYGWIGRYFDNACKGSDPTAAVNIGKLAPQSFASAAPMGVSVEDPEMYRWINNGEGTPVAMQTAKDFFKKISNKASGSGAALGNPDMMAPPGSLDYLQRTAMNAQLSSDKILEVVKKYHSTVTYPDTQIGASLKLVAQLIAGQLPTRIFYVTQGGYDTHSNQLADQKRLLTDLAAAMAAFQNDIKEQGNAERLLTFTFSEFGRRVAENASGGTDHGVAGQIYVFGDHIKAGIHGEQPSLTDLDQGDLKHHTDFRSVYATVIENWLGAKSEPILGRAFPKLGFI